jgi:hypothetical protein
VGLKLFWNAFLVERPDTARAPQHDMIDTAPQIHLYDRGRVYFCDAQPFKAAKPFRFIGAASQSKGPDE